MMPSLPLFDPAAHPDGWHNVRAPGGYEWWYFDAEDRSTDTQVVVILMQGFIFHPGYLRAFRRFIRRPTRHIPPAAADYPCAYACVYRSGKIWKQFFTQYPPEDFAASRDGVNVRIGPNHLGVDASGRYQLDVVGRPWHLTARGPVTEVGQSIRVSMSFTPTQGHDPIERTFLSKQMTGADHRWTIAAPMCEMSGMVEIAPGGQGSRLELAGRGYHDHNYGTAPIGAGLSRWAWGRAIFGERVLTFHYALPSSPAQGSETHLVEVAGERVRDLAPAVVGVDWSLKCRPAMMLRYPSTLRFAGDLFLSNPRVIDPSPFYLRLVYEAESRGERSQAFCEVAYPHRLSWPILGRMIEMSFDKRPLKRNVY